MRLPRDISGTDLAALLKRFGYSQTRQSGSHIRLTTFLHGEHHITIPAHAALRLGTLSSIISEAARHAGLTKDEVSDQLFQSK